MTVATWQSARGWFYVPAEGGGTVMVRRQVAPGEKLCMGHEPWWLPESGCPWCRAQV